MAGAMNLIAARSATESFQYFGRGAPPLFNGGGETQQIIPAVLDGLVSAVDELPDLGDHD